MDEALAVGQPDILSLSAEEFAQLEDWELQQAMQVIAGHMAIAQSHLRKFSEPYHRYLEAKEEFSRLRQMANILQTIVRTKV